MNLSVPLPPHLVQFIREQLASGLFENESDVILAALRLLEVQSHDHEPSRGQRHSSRIPGDEVRHMPAGRRSPRGLLADIRSGISSDDIKAARRELWSRFPSGEA